MPQLNLAAYSLDVKPGAAGTIRAQIYLGWEDLEGVLKECLETYADSIEFQNHDLCHALRQALLYFPRESKP